MKLALSALILTAFASVTLAVPHPPKPSAHPPPPPPPAHHPSIRDCRAQPLCCLTSSKANNRSLEGLLDLFRVRLTRTEEQELVGLTCSHINIRERNLKWWEWSLMPIYWIWIINTYCLTIVFMNLCVVINRSVSYSYGTHTTTSLLIHTFLVAGGIFSVGCTEASI